MSFRLSARSRARLSRVHPALIAVVERAIARTSVDFKIVGPAGRRALDADDADFPATSRVIDLVFG